MTDEEKLEALRLYEQRAIDNYEDAGQFRAAIEKMEAKMKQHGISPKQFLAYKKKRDSKAAIAASFNIQNPHPKK